MLTEEEQVHCHYQLFKKLKIDLLTRHTIISVFILSSYLSRKLCFIICNLLPYTTYFLIKILIKISKIMSRKLSLIVPIITLVFALLLSSTQAKGKIPRIDESNFQKFSKDNSYWIVQISDSPCNDCQSQQNQLLQAQQLLQGVCKIGKVDSKFLKGMNIPQNPTYLFLRSDKLEENVEFKEKKITKVALAKFCLDQIQKSVKKRHKALFGDAKNNRESSQETKSSSKTHDKTKVIELTDAQFQKSVIQSKQAWFVEFYSPSCGHCRSLQPEYNKLPGLMGKKVNIAKIDATKNQKMAQKYQIKGFPTMLLFEADSKQAPLPYEGQRTAQDIKSWLNSKKLTKSVKQLHELNKKNYEWNCNRNIVCLLFILENKAQKAALKFIKPLLEQTMDKPIQFFFSERIPIMESYLMIEDRNTPKIFATWQGISSYRIYNGKNTYEELKQFIEHIMQRKKWIKFEQKSVDLLFANSNQEL